MINSFHFFIHSIVKCLISGLGGKLTYYSILDKTLVDLDDFAKNVKAETVPFPQEFLELGMANRSMSIMSSKVYGTQNVLQINDDKIYRFKQFAGTCICRVTFMSIDYGNYSQTVLNIILAPNKEEALAVINEYYKNKRSGSLNRQMVLDKYGEKIHSFRTMKWEEIFLPGNTIHDIKAEIDTFFRCEEVYKSRNIVWKRGILMAGSPGNGKTSICRAVATNSKVPVIYCSLGSARDLHQILSNMQDTISANSPCIAIYEDADLFGKDDTTRAATLNMMDGLFTVDGVLTLATTNDPKKLDTAFTSRPSRFDSYYVIQNPTSREMSAVLELKLGKDFKKIKPNDKKRLLSGLKGFSVSFVQEVAVYTIMRSINEKKPIDSKLLFDSLAKVKKHAKSSQDGEDAWTVSLGFGDVVEDD